MDIQDAQGVRRFPRDDKAADGGNRTLGSRAGAGIEEGVMNAEENLTLMGMKLSIDKLAFEIAKQRQENAAKTHCGDLPEWITFDMAIDLKGGTALATYCQKPLLQPCRFGVFTIRLYSGFALF
jgi:hypothetical protein